MRSTARRKKIQTTTRPDHVWPEVWTKIGKATQNREKQEWTNEKPKLDNARRLRGIHFIDPDDTEYKEILKNARRKLERPMVPAMPCKRQSNITKVVAKPEIGSEKNSKTMYGCEVDSLESKRQREVYFDVSLQHGAQVHLDATSDENSRCKSCRGQGMEEARDNSSMGLEAQKGQKKVHFATLMDICHLKNAELEPKLQKYISRVVLRRDFVKDDSGAKAVFTEQGSSASQMTAAKIMDVIARLPDCDGQVADAITSYTQVKLKDAPRLLKIPTSECPDVWIRLPRHKLPKSWANIEHPVVPLERNLYGHPVSWTIMRKTVRRSFIKIWMGESTELGMSVRSSETKVFLVNICG